MLTYLQQNYQKNEPKNKIFLNVNFFLICFQKKNFTQ